MIYTMSKMFSFNLADAEDKELYEKVILPNRTDIEKNGWIFKESGSSVVTLTNIGFYAFDPKKFMDSKANDIFLKEVKNDEEKTDE